jgi:type II secretory pathway pseudopilin PulG
MRKSKRDSRGFTLIAALLLTVLLSALAVGLLFTVSNEVRMGGNDVGDNQAYYGAEAGMENLTAQLSQLYQTSQTPGAADINALTNPATAIYPTAIAGSNITAMNYAESITWPAKDPQGNPCVNPCGSWDIIGAGPDQGLVATIIPYNLQVTATRLAGAGQTSAYSSLAATGASVNMTRTVEEALIPAFEFGVFCDGDCDYFAGPNFNFGGRVHTNGNLFLASGAKLTFTDKIAVVGQVILDQLENGHATNAGYTGTVYAPSASLGCPAAPGFGPAANCLQLAAGSWTGGFPPVGAANPAWNGISQGTFNGFILNGLTGATRLQLPFVQAGVGPIEITRKPQPADTALMANSRLYNKAEIRILLADNQVDLHPERGAIGDGQDVPLTAGAFVVTGGGNMYYAMAKPTQNPGLGWVAPTSCAGPVSWSLLGQVTQGNCTNPTWLRVEYLNNAGNWVGVTTQWLGYGFGRLYGPPPTAPSGVAGQNAVGPAILMLQQLQSGLLPGSATGAFGTQYNWIPINFYDSREGEPRDPGNRAGTLVSPIGVMNAVELDVGNVWLWLQAAAGSPYTGGSGAAVNSTKDKGYILYFSDHRGMIPDPDPPYLGTISGASLLEDTVNAGSQVGVPDGALQPNVYYPYSPEDVDQSLTLNQQGAQHLGAGFGVPVANVTQPYYINGVTAGVNGPANLPANATVNMVTGPRHVLRLVDGGMSAGGVSYVPGTNAVQANSIGFTVASEEPVYVLGDYNSGPTDPLWAGGNNNTQHAASAIIADAVTLLSNWSSPTTVPANQGWTDAGSFNFPGDVSSAASTRKGNNSYYRMAIAAGKSIPFPQPVWGGQDFGTDGGMHNFLRYLEDRGAGGATVNYTGSMISMYYSQYATGTFKCCNVVYGAPVRNYSFDTLFLNPANLPPGTPMFQDMISLSYHQGFAPQ